MWRRLSRPLFSTHPHRIPRVRTNGQQFRTESYGYQIPYSNNTLTPRNRQLINNTTIIPNNEEATNNIRNILFPSHTQSNERNTEMTTSGTTETTNTVINNESLQVIYLFFKF